MPPQRPSVAGAAGRFLVAGLANTVVTALTLVVLSLWLDPRVAYTVVFAAGVVLAVVLADRYVYGVRMGRWIRWAYALLYVVVYLVGLGVVELIRRSAAPGPWSAAVVLVTAPLTFVGGRWLTRHSPSRAEDS